MGKNWLQKLSFRIKEDLTKFLTNQASTKTRKRGKKTDDADEYQELMIKDITKDLYMT